MISGFPKNYCSCDQLFANDSIQCYQVKNYLFALRIVNISAHVPAQRIYTRCDWIWFTDSHHYLQKPAAVTAPRLPVQDMFSLCRRVQRLCRWHREASVSRAQYGCRLSWMYCSGSQQCLWKSLQLWANRHKSGTARWLTISWISYRKTNIFTVKKMTNTLNTPFILHWTWMLCATLLDWVIVEKF